jgi:outer membrane immunogenic protein
MLRSLAFGVLSAVALIYSASAADMYPPETPGGFKDGPYVPAAGWAGFYIGANGGYAWNAGSPSFSAALAEDPTVALDPGGGFGGGQIGYNWRRNRVVLGVEADLQGAGISDHGSMLLGPNDHTRYAIATAESSLDWFGTVRGRIGYTYDRALVYFTAGLAFGKVEDKLALTVIGNGTVAAKQDDTLTGYVLGGGVEYSLSPAWSIKGEYQFMDLGSQNLSAFNHIALPTATESVNADHTYSTVRVGLNYHVGGGYVPLK